MKFKENINIPLDKFINLSLYDKKFGYYMKKNPFGKKGDFITAPNITRIFSEIMAIWIVTFWESLGSPKHRLTLVSRSTRLETQAGKKPRLALRHN